MVFASMFSKMSAIAICSLLCLLFCVQVESAQPFTTENDPPTDELHYIPPGNPSDEAYRVLTFSCFPVSSVSNNISTLAREGMLYTGYGNCCFCFSCGNVVRNWPEGADVTSSEWHLEDCRMLFRLDPDNIPLRQVFPSARSMFASLPFSSVAQEQFVRSLNLRYESQRLHSFLGWSVNEIVSHFDLARSGFVHVGVGLSVFCFSCFGVISCYNSINNIRNIHRQLFPHCDMANGFEFANIPIRYHERQTTNCMYFGNVNFPHCMQSPFNTAPSLTDQIPGPSGLGSCHDSDHVRYNVRSISLSAQGQSHIRNGLNSAAEPKVLIPNSSAVDNAMLSEIVKFALDLGFSYVLVKRVVAQKLMEGGLYESREELINDLLREED